MLFGRGFLIFGAGVVVGVVGARFLLSHPQGRQLSKTALKGGFAVTEWVARQVEVLREDLSDLVAEARSERELERGASTATTDTASAA